MAACALRMYDKFTFINMLSSIKRRSSLTSSIKYRAMSPTEGKVRGLISKYANMTRKLMRGNEAAVTGRKRYRFRWIETF